MAAPPLADVLDLLTERIVWCRFDDRMILYCNRAWALANGGAPDDFVGRPLDTLLTPSGGGGLVQQLARLGPETAFLQDHITRTEADRWTEWTDRYLPDPDGPHVLAVSRDVTEPERAAAGCGRDIPGVGHPQAHPAQRERLAPCQTSCRRGARSGGARAVAALCQPLLGDGPLEPLQRVVWRGNAWLVYEPGRRFPGLFVQGDTFANHVDGPKSKELLRWYEEMMAIAGLGELPYQ